jgi:hypothetical protein
MIESPWAASALLAQVLVLIQLLFPALVVCQWSVVLVACGVASVDLDFTTAL